MHQKTDRLYPSAPFENKIIDLEQRSDLKINDVNSFNIHIIQLEEKIVYLKT